MACLVSAKFPSPFCCPFVHPQAPCATISLYMEQALYLILRALHFHLHLREPLTPALTIQYDLVLFSHVISLWNTRQ